jgi:hypothetical protein
LNGTLTGQPYRETDQNAHKILEDWGKFYPIDMSDKDGDPAKTPALVEIIVGKFKIKASTGITSETKVGFQNQTPCHF